MGEATDGVAAHQFGGCCFALVHTACRIWSLSWRWMRDGILGLLISIPCYIISIIPGSQYAHTYFLFRTRPQKAEAQDYLATGPILGEGESDDQMRSFFKKFAPQVVRS